MIETSQILSVADKIAKQFHPERIILFGSYAYGTPNEDSDVDLLVVMLFEGRPVAKATEVRGAAGAGFPMDLLVYTPERLKHRLEIGDFFCGRLSKRRRCCMKPITQEWVDKAEGDWASAGRESVVRTDPNYDLVCFLAQQCAAKYLKAALQEESIAPPKTHDLEKLMDLLLPTQPFWKALLPALGPLSNYAVSFRYPGQDADSEEAQDALEHCRKVREVARRSFVLPL